MLQLQLLHHLSQLLRTRSPSAVIAGREPGACPSTGAWSQLTALQRLNSPQLHCIKDKISSPPTGHGGPAPTFLSSPSPHSCLFSRKVSTSREDPLFNALQWAELRVLWQV